MIPIPVPAAARRMRPLCSVVSMGPPEGVSEDDCGTVQMLISNDRIPGVGRGQYAYYRPTPQELEILSGGGFIEISQFGMVVQPFAATVWGHLAGHHEWALAMVRLERRRQVEVKAYTSNHDRKHPSRELLAAAHCYATCAGPDGTLPSRWPWDTRMWKPKDRRSNLIRGAALYLAELELGRLPDTARQDALQRFNDTVIDLAQLLLDEDEKALAAETATAEETRP